METSYWPLPLNKACTWLRPTRNPAVKGYQRADRGERRFANRTAGARYSDALFSASRRGASRDSSQLARAAGARVCCSLAPAPFSAASLLRTADLGLESASFQFVRDSTAHPALVVRRRWQDHKSGTRLYGHDPGRKMGSLRCLGYREWLPEYLTYEEPRDHHRLDCMRDAARGSGGAVSHARHSAHRRWQTEPHRPGTAHPMASPTSRVYRTWLPISGSPISATSNPPMFSLGRKGWLSSARKTSARTTRITSVCPRVRATSPPEV